MPAKRLLSDQPNIYLIDPLDYEPFIYLMTRAHLILTDSGGIQEEAPSLGKPVIVLREKTERTEALEAGTVLLAGTNNRTIQDTVEALMQEPDLYRDISQRPNPYGDGLAAQRILDILRKQLTAAAT